MPDDHQTFGEPLGAGGADVVLPSDIKHAGGKSGTNTDIAGGGDAHSFGGAGVTLGGGREVEITRDTGGSNSAIDTMTVTVVDPEAAP